MSEEKKALEYEVKDGFLILKVDPNKDGEPVVEVKVALAEVPDEVVDAIS